MYARGKVFLKVSGIAFVVWGAIIVICGFIGIIQPIEKATSHHVYTNELVALLLSGAWGIWRIFHYSYRVFIGVMGVIYCQNIIKANTLIVLSFIDFIAVFVGAYFTVALFRADLAIGHFGILMAFLMLPFQLVLPIIYLVGAIGNKNSSWK